MAKAWNNAFALSKKHTQGSTGIWEAIRRVLSVDPNRSNGIPIKHFRNPPPGSQDPNAYDDPVTVPAADIADNPYWKRDSRRNYPVSSHITQGTAVGLLSMGNKAVPSPKLLAGEEGTKQLVQVKEEGAKGLSVLFDREKGIGAQVLGEGGLPPMPVQTRSRGTIGAEKYEVAGEQSYKDAYPCRSFV